MMEGGEYPPSIFNKLQIELALVDDMSSGLDGQRVVTRIAADRNEDGAVRRVELRLVPVAGRRFQRDSHITNGIIAAQHHGRQRLVVLRKE